MAGVTQQMSMRSSIVGNGLSLRQAARPLRPVAAQRLIVRAAGAASRVGGGQPTGPQGTDFDEVPDRNKRTIMNLLLVGAIGLPGTPMLGAFIYYFFPKSSGNAGGGLVAKDALGNDVTASKWLASHKPGDRSLTQGLRSDATYLIVREDSTIEKYGLNAVCTHLGCVVPWNSNENKFKCPCHGSQYNNEGKVIRGPAPLSLALAHCDVINDNVTFSSWTETDFRTGLEPWWK